MIMIRMMMIVMVIMMMRILFARFLDVIVNY